MAFRFPKEIGCQNHLKLFTKITALHADLRLALSFYDFLILSIKIGDCPAYPQGKPRTQNPQGKISTGIPCKRATSQDILDWRC
jgi:hypothetical protein